MVTGESQTITHKYQDEGERGLKGGQNKSHQGVIIPDYAPE